MTQINGIAISLGNDGVIIWSDNWIELQRLAHEGGHGLSIRRGGPGTYGHTDIVVSALDRLI